MMVLLIRSECFAVSVFWIKSETPTKRVICLRVKSFCIFARHLHSLNFGHVFVCSIKASLEGIEFFLFFL